MASESGVVPSCRIVLLDRSAFPFDLKRPGFSHKWVEYRTTPQANVVERLRGATIAITNRVPVRRREIERLPELRMIAVAGTGYGQIDLAACRERGIVVSNLRGWCDCSVSEHVFALALALRRHLSEPRRQRATRLAPVHHRGTTLHASCPRSLRRHHGNCRLCHIGTRWRAWQRRFA